MIVVWIGVGVLGVLAFTFFMFAVLPNKVLEKVRAKLDERIVKTVASTDIVRKDTLALSYGLESRGVAQARGNGALVLTSTHLWWLQLTPQGRDVSIPLESITSVGTKRSHLGKRSGKPLLHVAFSADDQVDSMAWFNTDVPGWVEAIEQQRATAKPPHAP